MIVCGTCHSLIELPERSSTCPRCHQSVHPDYRERLVQFIELGVYPAKEGVHLIDARLAAKEALARIEELEQILGTRLEDSSE